MVQQKWDSYTVTVTLTRRVAHSREIVSTMSQDDMRLLFPGPPAPTCYRPPTNGIVGYILGEP